MNNMLTRLHTALIGLTSLCNDTLTILHSTLDGLKALSTQSILERNVKQDTYLRCFANKNLDNTILRIHTTLFFLDMYNFK